MKGSNKQVDNGTWHRQRDHGEGVRVGFQQASGRWAHRQRDHGVITVRACNMQVDGDDGTGNGTTVRACQQALSHYIT